MFGYSPTSTDTNESSELRNSVRMPSPSWLNSCSHPLPSFLRAGMYTLDKTFSTARSRPRPLAPCPLQSSMVKLISCRNEWLVEMYSDNDVYCPTQCVWILPRNSSSASNILKKSYNTFASYSIIIMCDADKLGRLLFTILKNNQSHMRFIFWFQLCHTAKKNRYLSLSCTCFSPIKYQGCIESIKPFF